MVRESSVVPDAPLRVFRAVKIKLFEKLFLHPIHCRSCTYMDIIRWFPDTIYFDVGTKLPKIVVDNHDFNFVRKSDTKTTWLCSSYFKTKCKTRATTNGRMVQITGFRHNHAPNPNRKQHLALMMSQQVTICRNFKS
ncbi:hypothetical protein HUJ05_001582 [Dendroctonus ponderosae]|nr:hypothetical protein HUJ05_001582 [Dendroctonus ponderosae]